MGGREGVIKAGAHPHNSSGKEVVRPVHAATRLVLLVREHERVEDRFEERHEQRRAGLVVADFLAHDGERAASVLLHFFILIHNLLQ